MIRIYVPFTRLRVETYQACNKAVKGGTFVICPIDDHEHGYAEYWIKRWQEGATFINVEHDVVPIGNSLQEMWDCPEPYCKVDYTYPFAGARRDVSPIGCAKFSSEFIAAHQGIFTHRLHWHEPQHIIINASLNKAHVHEPPALHLHVAPDWPLDAQRRFGEFR